ncbi:MAG TPA: ABC antibiotics transporter, partial [Actinomycetes bacterium]|nr:ABC antibiotics transporter [Actinomycetes bacterium]
LHREYVTLAVLAALMSTFAVIRHTRQNEELGRSEVLRSTVVGRYADLTAAVVLSTVANILLALLIGTALIVSGQPFVGSMLAGASVAAVGVLWVSVTAVACQLSSTTRGAAGLSSAALGLAFVLSGIGNMLGSVDEAGLRVTSSWPAWLSPIGWGQQTRPFGGAHWWPLLLVICAFAVLLAVALMLISRRDVGRGLVPERKGPADAKRTLLSTVGLTWRLQRPVFTTWAAGLVVFGLIFGSLTEQIQGMTGTSADWWTEVGGTAVLVDAYKVSIIQMAGVFVAIYVVQLLLRMRTDESGGTLESLLASGVSRGRWMWGHIVNAAVGSCALIVLFAASMALTAGQVLGETAVQMRELVWAGLLQVPGILFVGAVIVAVASIGSRWAVPVSWAFLLAVIVVGPMFGPGLDLPAWVQDLSPFTHSPKTPGVPIDATAPILIMGLCVAITATSLSRLRHRDLVLPA